MVPAAAAAADKSVVVGITPPLLIVSGTSPCLAGVVDAVSAIGVGVVDIVVLLLLLLLAEKAVIPLMEEETGVESGGEGAWVEGALGERDLAAGAAGVTASEGSTILRSWVASKGGGDDKLEMTSSKLMSSAVRRERAMLFAISVSTSLTVGIFFHFSNFCQK